MWRTLLIILFCAWSAQAQWANGYGGTGTDSAAAIATDPSGNILFCGYFGGTANFGGTNVVNAGANPGLVVAKYDRTGAHQWSAGYSGSGSIVPVGICSDPSGNIFVCGKFSGTVNFGGGSVTSSGGLDLFVVKYSSTGGFLWSKLLGDTLDDSANGVACDASGNVVVTGFFSGSVNFGGGVISTPFGNPNVFLAKYSSTGTYILAKNFSSVAANQGNGVALDSSGNIFLCGFFLGSQIDFGGGPLMNNGGSDGFVGKFTPSGGYIWATNFGGTVADQATGIAVDPSGNPILTGFFTTAATIAGVPLTTVGGSDVFLAKYNANGVGAWARGFSSPGSGDQPGGVAVDRNGNVVTTGHFTTTINMGGGVLNAPVPGNQTIFIGRYDNNGGYLFSQAYGGNGTDGGVSSAFDLASGSPILAGYFSGALTLGPTTLNSIGGSSDAFLFNVSGTGGGPNNWYVDSSKTGTSNNSGTSPANAFTNWVPLGGTDGQWTGVAKGGDTVWVYKGVGYVGNRTGVPDAINMYNIAGQPNKPVVFKAIQTGGVVITPPLLVSGNFFTFDGRLSDTYTNVINFDNMRNLYQITNNINWWLRGVYAFGSNGQNGIYMPNSGYQCKFQWLHVDPFTYNTNNYPFGNSESGVGANTHGINILQNTGEHLDGGEIAYCYIEEADQCCISMVNNNAPIWSGFRIHHNVMTKQGDAGMRGAGGYEVDHNIIGNPWTIHGHPNGIVLAPSYTLFHHNIVLNTLDTMMYTPGGGSPLATGVKVYNNLFYTTKDWSFIYTNQFSGNKPFVNHSVGGLQFLVEANANNFEPWLPQVWSNFVFAGNTMFCGNGGVATNANAGISGAISLPNRYAPGNSLAVEPGPDRGFILITNMQNLNNLIFNVSAAGSGQTLGGWQGWVDRFNANPSTWSNNAVTATAGILFDGSNTNGSPNKGSTNVVVDYNVLTANQAASKTFVYNGPYSTNNTYSSAEAFNTAYTTNTFIHNSSSVPSLVDTNYYDFHPNVADTVLIGNGTNLSFLTNTFGGLPQFNMDLSGVTRPARPAIGAYEPQYDMVLHLTFEDLLAPDNSTAIGISPVTTDITGYGNNMLYWGFTAAGTRTNWPARVPYTNSIGPGYNYAAQFHFYNTNVPAYGNFPISQFGGITNITALSNLSAITVSCWAKYDTNSYVVSTFIDTCEGSPGAGATWSLGRNSALQTSFDLFTNRDYNTSGTLHLNYPDNNSTDWHLYSATFNTTNQVMNIYMDGTNCGSKNFSGYSAALTNLIVGVPSSGGSYGGKNGWISIGCRTHVGSPNLADADLFPNNGWMSGELADMRVYNRELGAGEILAIYNGGGAANIIPTPGPRDPIITLNPLSQTVTAPATATFTSTASSTNSLTYQWFKNGSAIAGATQTTFTTPATTTSDNGSTYFMVATAGGRTAQSTTATLTVGAPGPQDPVITLNPVGQTVTAPATATFTSSATSTQSLTFQWSKNGVPIAGATQTTYTTPATVVGDNGSTYFMVATASGRTVQSSSAILTVNAGPQDPLITSSPLSQSVTAPATVTFTSTASSTQSLTFQWSKNGVPISGATDTTYTTPPTSTSDNGSTYFMVATAGGRTAQSATATLTVFPQGPQDPIITLNPLAQFVIAPNQATFTSTASSTNSLTYQWYKNGGPIAGATSTAYVTPPTTIQDNGSTFFMIATAGGRTVQSATVGLAVSPNAPSSIAKVTNLRVNVTKTGP